MYPMEHIWTIALLQILQAHLLRAFVLNLKLVAIFALCPESFCDKNLAALAERTVAIVTSIVKLPHLMNPNHEPLMNQVPGIGAATLYVGPAVKVFSQGIVE